VLPKVSPPSAAPGAPGGRRRPWLWFLVGAVSGWLALAAVYGLVNSTLIADRLVAPLLRADTAGAADAIVVLGAGVIGECTPNQSGILRTLLASRLWRLKRAPIVVFTGGPGGAGCPISEAMGRLAKEAGVADASIHLETASRTTRENAEFSAPLLQKLGVRRILLVTDQLHMRRGSGVFSHLGFEVERATVPMYERYGNNSAMALSAVRESLALAYYSMRGWVAPDVRPLPAIADAIDAGGQVIDMPLKRTYPAGPIVILGASYAMGWPLDSVAGVPVINLGVGGQQSFEMVARFEKEVVPAKPRAVILWGFINDFFRAPPGQIDAARARVQDSYTTMIRLARQHGIEPVLATEVTMRLDNSWRGMLSSWINGLRGRETYQGEINRHVIATNRWLAGVASSEGLVLLDFQQTLGGPGGGRRQEFALSDGSHLSPQGYDALTEFARTILETRVINR
jgi:uncharacterized SAM-binding protein YcdF (DUF218 family)/lysophospholipase L1-like esterase